ncbi:MAG: hypothetical protein ICV70_04705 [Jiangellaceae bacterium]|nr:hypothetical protein [Jiangellaceae bacterium]
MNTRNIARIGTRLTAVFAVLRSLRLARREGDKLRMVDAIVNALAIATAIAILIREIRERRDEEEVLDEDLM